MQTPTPGELVSMNKSNFGDAENKINP